MLARLLARLLLRLLGKLAVLFREFAVDPVKHCKVRMTIRKAPLMLFEPAAARLALLVLLVLALEGTLVLAVEGTVPPEPIKGVCRLG